MGSSFSYLKDWWLGSISARIAMVGLDNAGKTTLVQRMKLGPMAPTEPTIGFNVDTFTYKNVTLTVWDIGGSQLIHDLWKHYFVNTQAVIFVVDSTDRNRLEEVRDELHALMKREELAGSKLLVLNNKCDLPESIPSEEVSEHLGLRNISSHEWAIVSCSAKTDKGVAEAMEMIHMLLSSKKSVQGTTHS